MLDTLTLVEQRHLPALAEPRPSIAEKMLALAALIDTPVDLHPHRSGILPAGCWWLPHANLILAGTPCRRPLMFDEMRDISRATDLSAIVVRYNDTAPERSRVSFDVFHEDVWHARHLLWIDATETSGWMLPDLGVGRCLRLSQWGVELCEKAPHADLQDRIDGLDRGARYLNGFIRWR